jgi:hypothetical protein
MRDNCNSRLGLTLFLVTVFLLTSLGFSGGKVYAQDITSDTPTPETLSTETATPEATLHPTLAESPTQEPTLAETPIGEPTLAETPTQEPTLAETPTGEPTLAETATQEPTLAVTPTPEPGPTETPAAAPNQPQITTEKISDYFSIQSVTLANGMTLIGGIINGPPTPPPGYDADRTPVEIFAQSERIVADIPAYSWVFGCSAVSASMIAGYYDRSGYPNMYRGPTDGGLAPLTDSSWPSWTDGSNKVYPNNPLVASHNGSDGRTTRGSIDDYWVQYLSTQQDPFINNWSQHDWGVDDAAIGDYMMTSQSNFQNNDGSTTFWNSTSSAKLTCDTMETLGFNDGTLGRRNFYKAQGYAVSDCYNQNTDNNYSGGFSLANFKTQIDAGHPVLLNLEGHTVVGVGYNSSSSTIYIHDTWDTLTHTMTWGKSYVGMKLLSVSVVNLADAPNPPVLVSPDAAVNVGQPAYKWNQVTPATGYQLKVTNTDTSEVVINQSVAKSACSAGVCSITPAVTLTGLNYTFEVASKNGSAQSAFSSPMTFSETYHKIPAAPALDTPATGFLTNNTAPELKWKVVSYGATFDLAISSSSSFPLPLVQDHVGLSGLSKVIDPITKDGKYYWRVRAANVDGGYGPWSSSRYFTVDTTPPLAPVTGTPANGASVTGTPTFSWKASTSASRYQFEYNNVDDAETNLYQSGELTTLSYKPPTIEATNPHSLTYWFVRAKDAAGNWSAWSAASTVTITPSKPAAPALDTPATGFLTNNSTPEFKWKSVAYGATFELAISSSSSFPSPLIQDYAVLSGLSKVIDPLTKDGKYYWRVRAANVDGVFGSWSSSRYFTLDTTPPLAPVPGAPANGTSQIGTPTFSWKASATASRYQFEYNNVDDAETHLYQSGELTTLTHKPPAMAATNPSTPVYWFVRAKDAAGNWGAWSAPAYTVTILPPLPAKPVLSAPATGFETDDTSLNLSWLEVPYGYHYEIEVSDTSSFPNPYHGYHTDEGELSVETGRLNPGKWYWRVQALNFNWASGPWSATNTFIIYPKFNTQFNTDNNFESWRQYPGANWFVTSGSMFTNGIDDYKTSSAGYAGMTFTNFTYEARMKMTFYSNYSGNNDDINNVYGLFVRGTPTFNSMNDWKNGYYFLIGQVHDSTNNANYACYNVYKISNWTMTSLTSQGYWWCSTAINFNDWNTLKVYAKGTKLNFYINDSLVISKTVSGPTSGEIGVVTWRPRWMLEPIYVDWAVAGAPVLPTAAEQAATGQAAIQIPFQPKERSPFSR